ncbi:MAG: hypothetical protein L3J74_14315 [Bacteroidales bacterium]|nr:hypothetical protein [Bacteroidales bacterium]
MKNVKNSYLNRMQQIYHNLSYQERLRRRREITSLCGISTYVFYNWLRGTTPIPPLAVPVVAEVFNVEEEVV